MKEEYDNGKYEGDMLWDGKMSYSRHGHGTYTWNDGSEYVGGWQDGEKHGQATNTYANGNEYVGEFRYGARHGHGTYTYASGDKYVGEYQDGKMHGQGTLTWADGTKKTGCFINDQYMPDICEGMGFVKGTEAYTNCVLELIKKL